MTDGERVTTDVPPEPGDGSPHPLADGGTVRVVIVDDQAPFRSVARTLVGMIRGWAVVGEAETGEDGVALSAALAPHMVLMDINLPGISGIDATRQIVREHPDTRVVLVSTYAGDDLPEDALSCGATGYLRKDDLTQRLLRSMLERPRP